MGHPVPQVIALGDARFGEVAALIGRAFQDDPLFVHGCPDPSARARWLPWSFLWSITKGELFGQVLGTAGDLTGVAIAVGPSGSDLDRLVAAVERARAPRRAALAAGEAETFGRYDDAVGAAFEPADAALHLAVAGPHWYVDVVAVEPARQGRGVGTALLDAVHGRADADGVPTVLLTYQSTNLPFYRRLGYGVACQGTVAGALPWWGLCRGPGVSGEAGD